MPVGTSGAARWPRVRVGNLLIIGCSVEAANILVLGGANRLRIKPAATSEAAVTAAVGSAVSRDALLLCIKEIVQPAGARAHHNNCCCCCCCAHHARRARVVVNRRISCVVAKPDADAIGCLSRLDEATNEQKRIGRGLRLAEARCVLTRAHVP